MCSRLIFLLISLAVLLPAALAIDHARPASDSMPHLPTDATGYGSAPTEISHLPTKDGIEVLDEEEGDEEEIDEQTEIYGDLPDDDLAFRDTTEK